MKTSGMSIVNPSRYQQLTKYEYLNNLDHEQYNYEQIPTYEEVYNMFYNIN